MLDEIIIDNLKSRLIGLLRQSELEYVVETNNRGTTYRIATHDAAMEITIGTEWIGYELNINKLVTDKNIGTANDTDNYDTGGQNASISLSIFDEALGLAGALAAHKIYVGIAQRKRFLAFPLRNITYRIIYFGRFSAKYDEIKEPDLLKMTGVQTVT